MKVTKYPQSHLVIEKDGKKIMIDPGDLTFDNGFKVADFKDVETILVTHIHPDHLAQEHLDELKQLVDGKKVFGNNEVVEKLGEFGVECEEVTDRQKFSVSGFEIEPIELAHFRATSNITMPKNTGYVLDGVFFDAGDGYELKGLTVDNAALALGGPSVSSVGVLEFIQSLGAKVYIPIHYDIWKRDPAEINKLAGFAKFKIDVRTLNFGEETEI